MQRVMLTTGGTGGHIFPALAVAEEMRERFPDVEFLFVGGEYGPEREIVGRASIPFKGLPVRGVLGRGFRAVGAAFGMLRGILRAMHIIGKFKPDVIIGFGGYAAFASCLAGRLRGVPVAIHEQNSVPGVANKLVGRWADRIFISLPDNEGYFDRTRTVLTGNPVRKDIMALRSAEKAGKNTPPRLLVVGGSLGAKALNDAVIAMLPELQRAGIAIRHQTGKVDEERVQAAYAKFCVDSGKLQCTASAFITDMAKAYAESDIVLCRAGATTVAELTVAGKPAVFVPFPHATHNHQVHNARHLVDCGAALMVEEKELHPALLANELTSLLQDEGRITDMADASRMHGRPEAAAAVVSGAMDILYKKPLKRGEE